MYVGLLVIVACFVVRPIDDLFFESVCSVICMLGIVFHLGSSVSVIRLERASQQYL